MQNKNICIFVSIVILNLVITSYYTIKYQTEYKIMWNIKCVPATKIFQNIICIYDIYIFKNNQKTYKYVSYNFFYGRIPILIIEHDIS